MCITSYWILLKWWCPICCNELFLLWWWANQSHSFAKTRTETKLKKIKGREGRFFINWVIRKQIWKLTKEWRRDGVSNKSANAVHWRKACFLSSHPHHVSLSCNVWVCHIHDYNNRLATPTLCLSLSLSRPLCPPYFKFQLTLSFSGLLALPTKARILCLDSL